MIVDTMSLEEMVVEIQKDDTFLYRKKEELVKKDVKALKARGLKDFPYYYTREVVSNRKNRHILCFQVLSHTALKNPNEVRFSKYTLLEKPGRGLYVYVAPVAGYGNAITEYTPHFFHRYAERSGFEGNAVQVIRQYFAHNYNDIMTSATVGGVTHAAIATNEGVAFGVVENGHHLTRTFVTYNLLFPEQKHFQEILMKPWELYGRYATNRFDPGYAQLVRKDRDKLNEEINQAFICLWETYAKKNLKMNATVHRKADGSFELIDRDNADEITEDAPAPEVFTFTENATHERQFEPNLIDDKATRMRDILQSRRVTPATIFRRKKK